MVVLGGGALFLMSKVPMHLSSSVGSAEFPSHDMLNGWFQIVNFEAENGRKALKHLANQVVGCYVQGYLAHKKLHPPKTQQ